MCREDSTLRTYKEFKNTIEIENCLLTKTEQLHMYRAWTIYGPEKKTIYSMMFWRMKNISSKYVPFTHTLIV